MTPSNETARTFIQASEIWVPRSGKLVHAGGAYGSLSDFAETSLTESFALGEGLPGKAWSEKRPIVLKEFNACTFKRTEAAASAGLSSAVAIPVFNEGVLLAVLVLLCGEDETTTGAIEIWHEKDGFLLLDDGYYGAAKHFEWVSKHTHFPRGQGLPGGVWASDTPILMRDLGSGYRFVRADSAGRAGLTTGIGIPIHAPLEKTHVLTLLSARGTPIARRFEIWDARPSRVGKTGTAILIDGICEREGPLWREEGEERVAQAWQGLIGQLLGSGLPVVAADKAGIAAGYGTFIALPIHKDGALSHIVAWYC